MSRVFVVQNQHRQNPHTGKLQPVYDISSAQEFGMLEFLLSPRARPFTADGQQLHLPSGIIAEMSEKLCKFTDDDYLLLIGNPCFIGFAVALAAKYNEGRVKLLQWHGMKKEYIPIEANLYS